MVTFEKYKRDKALNETKNLSINSRMYNRLEESIDTAVGGGEVDNLLKSTAGFLFLMMIESKKMIQAVLFFRKKYTDLQKTMAAGEIKVAEAEQEADEANEKFEETWKKKMDQFLEKIPREKRSAVRAAKEQEKSKVKDGIKISARAKVDKVKEYYKVLTKRLDKKLSDFENKTSFITPVIKTKWENRKEEIKLDVDQKITAEKIKQLLSIKNQDENFTPEMQQKLLDRVEGELREKKEHREKRMASLKEKIGEEEAQIKERTANASEDEKEAITLIADYNMKFREYVEAVEALSKAYNQNQNESVSINEDDSDEIKQKKEAYDVARKNLAEAKEKLTPSVIKKGMKLSYEEADGYLKELEKERADTDEQLKDAYPDTAEHIKKRQGEDEEDKTNQDYADKSDKSDASRERVKAKRDAEKSKGAEGEKSGDDNAETDVKNKKSSAEIIQHTEDELKKHEDEVLNPLRQDLEKAKDSGSSEEEIEKLELEVKKSELQKLRLQLSVNKAKDETDNNKEILDKVASLTDEIQTANTKSSKETPKEETKENPEIKSQEDKISQIKKDIEDTKNTPISKNFDEKLKDIAVKQKEKELKQEEDKLSSLKKKNEPQEESVSVPKFIRFQDFLKNKTNS